MYNIHVKLYNTNISNINDDFLLKFGIIDKQIKIIDDTIIIPSSGFVYIYGISGSGKSYTLKTIANKLKTKIHKFNPNIYSDKQILLKDYITDIKLLSKFGFSDIPTLFTNINNLSDGQKYRLWLLELLKYHNIILIDEFCNCLDEISTLSVLNQILKNKNNKLIITATSRPINYKYFDIDYVYEINNKISRIKYEKLNIENDIKIKNATLSDWKHFSKQHYRNKTAGIFNKALKISFQNKFDCGIIVAGQPYLNISVRNKLFPKYKNNGKLVNKDIFMIHRIVISPEFRNLGLSKLLINNIIQHYPNKKIVELITSINDIIPFLEKCNFIYGGQLPDNPVKKRLIKLNFDFNRYLDDEYLYYFTQKYTNQLIAPIKDSFRAGLKIKKKSITIDDIVKIIKLKSNITTKYYYKLI